MLTRDFEAHLEVHAGDVRAVLEHLNVACDLRAVGKVDVRQFRAALESLNVACSSCSLFNEQKVPSERSREKLPTKVRAGTQEKNVLDSLP